MSSLKQSVLKRILRDVAQGYSLSYYKGERIYVQHLGLIQQIEIDDYREEHYQSAKKRGVPTEAEVLDLLEEEKQWTKKDEKEIKDKQLYIDSLIENKSGLYLQSQLERQDKIIEESRKELQEKLIARQSLIGNTCEEYADKRCIDLYVIKSFFHDQSFSDSVFTNEEYDELTQQELQEVHLIYDKIFKVFTEENFQKLVVDDFYNVYMNACDSPINFFGKPTLQLTHYQIRLYSYTIMFKGIFNSGEEMPHAIKGDPQKILDWARNPKGRERAKEIMEKSSEGGAGLFGATKEDLEALGVETSGAGTVSLEKAAKKKGGTLNMQDLMKLSGMG